MNRILLFCAVASSFGQTALAQHGFYSPFGPEEDHALSLPACETARQISPAPAPASGAWEGTVDFSRGAAKLSLHVRASGIDEVRVFEDGSTAAGATLPVALDISLPSDVREEAVCADLNRDGRVDFVVSIWGHGNGLGASDYLWLVGLSTSSGYRFWSLDTMGTAPESFVTFGDLAPSALLATAFVHVGTSDHAGPNQRHSYFAYDLWTFRGGDIVSANAIDARFPKYVQMTNKENHKASIRMSSNRPLVAGDVPKLLGAVEQR